MTINKSLRWIILFGLFVIPFLPLLVASSLFFPFISGKGFVFRTIIEIVFASWLILALRDKNYWPQKSYLLYSVLALLMVTSLAALFSLNPYRSFWSNYERMGGLVSLLHLGAYFVVLISVLKKKTEWFWLANTALVGNWIINIYSFSQLMGWSAIHQGSTRIDATLGNATYLAVYLLFNIFFSTYLFTKTREIWLRFLYAITAIIDVFLLYHTATRGTILGLILGAGVATGLYLLMAQNQKNKKIAGVVLSMIVVLVAGFWLVKNTSFVRNSPVLERFASISLTETTTQSRFLVWNMSWQGFKDHPLLGWGPENYSMVFSKYYDPAMWRQEPWFDRSHNVFFDWLIDAGLLGLLAYLTIFAVAGYYLWRGRSRFGDAGTYLLLGLLAGYFFQNIFVFDNLISYLYFFALVAFIHFIVTQEPATEKNLFLKDYRNQNNQSLANVDIQSNVIITIVVIVLLGSLYYVNYQPWRVSRELIQAIHPNTTSDQSLVVFRGIFNRQTFGSGEALEQLINKTINVINNSQVPNDLKRDFVSLTDEQIKTYLTRFTQDARAYQFFGSYFLSTGRTAEGLDLAQRAEKISPRKQPILFLLASAYVEKKDANKALEVAKKAFTLDPNFIDARKIYAIILLMTNQNKLAQEVLAPIKDSTDYYKDSRFIDLYRQMGNQAEINRMKALQTAAASN